MAGVALGDIHLDITWQAVAQTHSHRRFAWQAWHLWYWVARLVRLCRLGTAPLCVAGVALGDIHLDITWQAWHKLTATVVLRGRRGTYGTGWRAWSGFVAWAPRHFAWQAVALGDIHLDITWQAWQQTHSHRRFAWQAWHFPHNFVFSSSSRLLTSHIQ